MAPTASDITSIVLAGGRSSRLGRDKAGLDILGKTLLQRVVERLAAFSAEIIIATAGGVSMPCTAPVMVRYVADVCPGKGPLAGIHAGLLASTVPSAVVVGCDMPFVAGGLLQHMHALCERFDAVVAAPGGQPEPLCAVYSIRCLGAIEMLLRQDSPRIRDVFELLNVRYVAEAEFDRFDPGRLSLFNVNSCADLETARKLAAGEVTATLFACRGG